MNQDKINEERNTLIGRLFTLGGSLLFFIGSIIAAVVAYQSYNSVLAKSG